MKKKVTNDVTPEIKASLKVRIITAIVGTLIVLPCIFFGDYFFLCLILLTVGIGGYELVRCAKKKYNPALYIVTILLMLLFAVFPILRHLLVNGSDDFHLYTGFNVIYVSASVILLGALLSFSMVIIDKNFEVRDACYMLSFGIIVGLGCQCLLFLRYYPMYEAYNPNLADGVNPYYFNWVESALLLVLVVGGSLMSDTGAYFTGVFFGKNKINERISPKKTWEGFAGGIAFSMVFTLALGYGMAAVNRPIIAIFGLDANNWFYLLIVSIIIPLVSPLGDFIFSMIKRSYGVKDFGNILPGHGGVLDRIDSVLFSAISVAILIILFNCIYTGNWGNLLL